MSKRIAGRLTAILFASALGVSVARADLAAEVGQASAKIRAVGENAESLAVAGDYERADDVFLALFPAATRTPAQSLVLGNVFYPQAPKLSYALHKAAAAALPADADAQYEWALEQHRAGEWAGALASYQVYTKTHSNFAPAYGLMADCLIRLQRPDEALAAWRKSESASGGSIDAFESLVCEVHTPVPADTKRRAWIAKVNAGDLDAAESLVALDVNFARDWWSTSIQSEYLKADVERIHKQGFKDADRVKAIDCVAELAAAGDDDAAAVQKVLQKYGYVTDNGATLPTDGGLASFVISRATQSRALKKGQPKTVLIDHALASARQSNDAEMFNVAANLALGSDRLAEIDRDAWKATGDARFIGSLLAGKMQRGALTAGDADLADAIAKASDNAYVAAIAISVAAEAKQPMREPLIRGIAAEYARFSAGGLAGMPSAATLRSYFASLAKEPKAPATTSPATSAATRP